MSPTLGRNYAGTSAGATGGKLKPTPAVEAIAPQVNTAPRGRKTVGKHPQKRSRHTRLLPNVKSDYDFQNKIDYHGSHN